MSVATILLRLLLLGLALLCVLAALTLVTDLFITWRHQGATGYFFKILLWSLSALGAVAGSLWLAWRAPRLPPRTRWRLLAILLALAALPVLLMVGLWVQHIGLPAQPA